MELRIHEAGVSLGAAFPPGRTFTVLAESRTLVIPVEPRMIAVPHEDRTVRIT